MILHIDKTIDTDLLDQLCQTYKAILITQPDKYVLVTPAKYTRPDEDDEKYIREFFAFDTDMQLSSAKYLNGKREIKIGNNKLGGQSRNVMVTIGPCSVETEEQIRKSAGFIKELGLSTLRAGSFKPRTSPYTFQGLGLEGLKLLDKMRSEFGLKIITEVRDSTHVDDVIAYADIIQIGAKSMYDHGILRKCGKSNKPVLLKRGFGTTLQEFVQASEFILSGGNEQVILCERGIRTFETKTRFTLDLCGVAYLKENTNLPVILDPSHAMGYSYGVPDLAKACMAMDVEGLLIEVHPNPLIAQSDASQQLNHDQFRKLFDSLKTIAQAVNRQII